MHSKRKLLSVIFLVLLTFSFFVPLLIKNIPIAHASILINEDFEDGDYTSDPTWGTDNAGTYELNVQTGVALFGTYGLNATCTGDSARALLLKSVTATDEAWADFYWYPDILDPYAYGDTFASQICLFEDVSANGQGKVMISKNATSTYFTIYGYDGGVVYNSSSVLTPTVDTLYHIRFAVLRNAGAGYVKCWVNDTLAVQLTGIDNTGRGQIARVKIGLSQLNSAGVIQQYLFDNIVVATSKTDFSATPQITVSNPSNSTYYTKTIPVSLSVDAGAFGTVDQIWYNLYNGSFVYGSNQTYTTTTSMSNIVNGTYTFYAYANNTEGTENSTSLMFTVAAQEPSTYTPSYYADMLLTTDGNQLKLPNGTVVVLKGVCKAEMVDDPDGSWGGSTMWDNDTVEAELDKYAVWGFNVIRIHTNIYDWKLGTSEAHSAISQKNAVKYLSEFAGERGIYVVVEPFRIGDYWNDNDTITPYFPYPPYTNNTNVIASIDDYIDYCVDVGTELRDYANVLFEPYNEPQCNSTTLDQWLNVVQNVTLAMRSANFTQPIVVQAGQAAAINVAYPNSPLWDLSWVADTNYTDPNDNWIVSDHKYRNHLINSSDAAYYCYEYDDVYSCYEYMDYFDVIENHVIFVGEIGANFLWTGTNWDREAAFFNNSLAIFNAYNISYAAFWWRYSGAYSLIYTNSTPTKSAKILINNMHDEPFVWTIGSSTSDIYSNDVSYSSAFSDGVLNATGLSETSTVRAWWNVSTSYALNSTVQVLASNGTVYDALDYYSSTTNLISVNIDSSTDWVAFGLDMDQYNNYTLSLTVNKPANTTYTTSTIPVNLATSGNETGTITVTWNVQFANETWLYGTNQTYSGQTSFTIGESLTATFCAHAVGSGHGISDYEEVMFTVSISEASYVISLHITSPTNTTYTQRNIPISISLSVTGNDSASAYSWNILLSDDTWFYYTNKTTSSATVTLTENGTYTFCCHVLGAHASEDYEEVMFSAAIVEHPTLPSVNVGGLWAFLYAGDFIGFFNALLALAFTSLDIAVGVVAMIFLVPLYIRTKSLLLVCIGWILTGSFLIVAMPLVSGVAVLFLSLGIGGTIYRLFRPSNR